MKSTNIMSKLIARDIAKNLLQYLSMIIINMLAVTLFCGFISNAETLNKTLTDYYTDSNLTDLICQYSSTVTLNDMQFLNSLDTDEIEYRFYSEGSANRMSAKIYVCGENNKISLPILTEGTRGVVIDKHVAELEKLSIGSEIEIEIPFRTTKLTGNFAITGMMNFAEVSNTYSYSPVYINSNVLAEIFPLAGSMFNQALIKTDSPAAVKQEINNYYQTHSGLIFVYDRDSMESVVMLNNEISQSLKMIYVFPVIFLLVAVLVILSTIGPLILRERTNIGTLKGIGITNKRILFHYASFGAVLCFIGGIFGIIIGPFIVPNVMLIKYNIVYSIPKFSAIVFSPVWSIAAVSAVCLLAALIGFFVCHQTVREKPAACMRPMPPKENFIIKKTSGNENSKAKNIPLKMAGRNIILKPSRAFMAIIGIMGCVALLVCSFGIGDTVNNSIDLELGRQFKYDIATTYIKETEANLLLEMENLKSQGKIDYYESYKIFYMSAQGKNIKDIKIFELPQNPGLTTIYPNGRTLITKSVAEDLGVRKGDTVILTSTSGLYDLRIDEVIETSYTKGIFIDTNLLEGNYCSMGMWIKSSNPNAELLDEINALNGTTGAYSMSEMRSDVGMAISTISTIKLTLMVFAIALSVVVLYNLSLLNIKERSRDIATMKVLGFTHRQVSLSLLYEIMLLVFVGTAFGLLLGFPITYLVLSINRIEALAFIYYIKPISYVISAGISILSALAINLVFTRQIKKINMIESLKSVE